MPSPPPRDSVITIGTVHRIHSTVLGEDRPYLIYEPAGARGRPMPLIVLLDGDDHFHHTTGAVRFLVEQERMPPVRLVAVPNTSDRTRDLTSAIFGDTAARRTFPTAGGAAASSTRIRPRGCSSGRTRASTPMPASG